METLRVLVVDDEAGMRAAVTRALRAHTVALPDQHGEVRFEAAEVDSGEAALARIEESPPDIVLLDHKLPGLSGLDVLDRLAGRKLDLLVVMITAYASLETAVVATRRGAYDFLAKPFTPDELRAALFKAAKHLVIQRQARRLAEERRRVRFEFISVLAHEMKAPLAAAEGYLMMLRDRTLGGEVAAYDDVVRRASVRLDGMRKLIVDLLDLTRIESGQKRRELADVDLRDVAQTALETAAPAALARGIALNLNAPGPVVLSADRGELELIFNNLVSNAVKYNRDRGRVDVALTDGPSEVTIRVADTGIGMTPEEAGRLFGEFVRIKNDKTRRIDGSGLGLSIVKKLVLLYGGRVTVESEPDVGTTFCVVLPRAAAAAGAPGDGAGPAGGEAPAGTAGR